MNIKLKKGLLHGYTLKNSLISRREILKNLTKSVSINTIIKRLNVLYIFNKNKHPENAKKFRNDMKFLQRYRDNNNNSENTISYRSSIKKRRSVKRINSPKRNIKRRSINSPKRNIKRRSINSQKRNIKRRSINSPKRNIKLKIH